MKVLVIGSGGREHALIYKIAQSQDVTKIFCAPGNAGISQLATCVDIKVDDLQGLLNFAKREQVDFTVVGPEQPLALGIVDLFTGYSFKIFGPNQKAAQLESSKVFAKEFMAKYHIPTAPFRVFEDFFDARNYVLQKGAPIVIKADGLAQGKGVVVAGTVNEAERALEKIMQEKVFGDAGKRVVIEDCLQGQEASILVFTDLVRIIPLASSQDHKRVFDQDKGANTGGMGAYSPAPIVTNELFTNFLVTIGYPLIDGLIKEHIDYRGVLYFGIIINQEGIKVLEFNVRFGDPETQVILPRLKTNLVDIMSATSEGQLSKFLKGFVLSWDNRPSVCVVCSSAGYPGDYTKGKEIFGLDEANSVPDVTVFHSGTKILTKDDKPQIVTDGGRVLGVSGLGMNLEEAIDKTYRAVAKIKFEGMHYRRDIGQKALKIFSPRRF
ncbi:phosphoribosylamine--glycine ligase [bacterium]|nr:MAG: phosphoribosylamine--glycine ligase [bacterium]